MTLDELQAHIDLMKEAQIRLDDSQGRLVLCTFCGASFPLSILKNDPAVHDLYEKVSKIPLNDKVVVVHMDCCAACAHRYQNDTMDMNVVLHNKNFLFDEIEEKETMLRERIREN